MQVITKPAAHQISESEAEEVTRFNKSLQELKELRSQLHDAADYCEASFLNAKEKRIVLDNTKEYLCRSVVAIVDHLGCISANLNGRISNANAFSQAEHRINCLKQRVLSCEQYVHKLALTRVRWSTKLPKFHRRYLSAPITNAEKSHQGETASSPLEKTVNDEHGFDAKELPLFLYTYASRSSSSKTTSSGASSCEKGNSDSSALVLPVRDGISMLSKGPNPTFHFQQNNQKRGRSSLLFRRSASAGSNDILALIRRTKRTT